MRRINQVATAAACVMLLMPAGALRAESPDPTSGDVVLFPAPAEIEFETRMPASKKPGVPMEPPPAASRRKLPGVHIPGNHFRAGAGWWTLRCRAGGPCRLAAARLGITRAIHPVYDADPVPSQVLTWADADGRPDRPAPGETDLIVFKPVRALAALSLRGGEVPTWLHQAMPGYPGTADLGRPGTMEVRVPTPGATTLLIPRLQRNPDANPKPAPGAPAAEGDSLTLELRINDRRQLLGDFDSSGIEGLQPRDPKQYLLWSGDLDGDGKPDFLIDFSGTNSRRIALFLSSLARDGQLVGEAGRFDFSDPSLAGC